MDIIYKPFKDIIMKKLLRFCLPVLLMMIVSVSNSNAQVQVIENFDVQLKLTVVQTGVTYTITDGIERITISPSGAYNKIITFQLDPDDPFLDLANPYAFIRLSLWADVDGDGIDDIKLKDKHAVISPSGIVKLNYHYKEK